MKFCDICDNMMYHHVEKGDTSLKLYCKNCNFESIEVAENQKSICIATKNFASDVNSYKNYMTTYIKYDPSLPRVNNIKCPSCKPEKNEVIYLKYDHDNMRYLYFCCNCEHFWKSDEEQK